MGEATSNQAPAIMHICGLDAEGDRIDSLNRRLEASSVPVVSVSDVYMAMVRLCDPGRVPMAGIIVEVDGFGPHELEFFSVVSRRLGSIPVFAYSASGMARGPFAAVDHGAHGVVTDKALDLLLSSAQADFELDDEEVDDVAAATEEDVEVEQAEPVEDEPDVPVRVPWLRYNDTPKRGGPGEEATERRSDPDVHRDDAGRAARAVDRSAPLLTDEELKALLSDDISGIAPGGKERDQGIEGSRDQGGGPGARPAE